MENSKRRRNGKMVKQLKFKDLKKLSKTVEGICLFAEEIKAKVNTDLDQIQQTKIFISEKLGELTGMQERLKEAEKTLEKLGELLE